MDTGMDMGTDLNMAAVSSVQSDKVPELGEQPQKHSRISRKGAIIGLIIVLLILIIIFSYLGYLYYELSKSNTSVTLTMILQNLNKGTSLSTNNLAAAVNTTNQAAAASGTQASQNISNAAGTAASNPNPTTVAAAAGQISASAAGTPAVPPVTITASPPSSLPPSSGTSGSPTVSSVTSTPPTTNGSATPQSNVPAPAVPQAAPPPAALTPKQLQSIASALLANSSASNVTNAQITAAVTAASPSGATSDQISTAVTAVAGYMTCQAALDTYNANLAAYNAAQQLAASCTSPAMVVVNQSCVYKCPAGNAISPDGTGCVSVTLNSFEVVDQTTGKVVCDPSQQGTMMFAFPTSGGGSVSRCVQPNAWSLAPANSPHSLSFQSSDPGGSDNGWVGQGGSQQTISQATCQAINNDPTGANLSSYWNNGVCSFGFRQLPTNSPNFVSFSDQAACPAGTTSMGTLLFPGSGWAPPTDSNGKKIPGTSGYWPNPKTTGNFSQIHPTMQVCKGPVVKNSSIVPALYSGDNSVYPAPTATDPNFQKAYIFELHGTNNADCQNIAGASLNKSGQCYMNLFNYSDTVGAYGPNDMNTGAASPYNPGSPYGTTITPFTAPTPMPANPGPSPAACSF